MAITADANGPPSTVRAPGSARPRPPPVCRFFGQSGGCRAGDQCRFRHQSPQPSGEEQQQQQQGDGGRRRGRQTNARDTSSGTRGATSGGTARRVQIEDLLRAPQWTTKKLSSERGETAFAVEMEPSDPDFPFEVSRLYLALVVPAAYPARRPSDPLLEIEVANKDIPAGIKRNIEAGFAANVRTTAGAAMEAGNPDGAPSLVDHLAWLDRNLEALMQQRPAPTIKFVSFSAGGEAGARADRPAAATIVAPRPAVSRPVPRALAAPQAGPEGPGSTQRALELGQLERRFRGSYAVVRETPAEGTVIRLDIAPTDPDIGSYDIAAMTCTIAVARSYPQAPDGPGGAASLALDAGAILGARGKASAWQPAGGRAAYLAHICQRFNEHVAEVPGASLLHHLNWLDRQLVDILASPPPAPTVTLPAAGSQGPEPTQAGTVAASKTRMFDAVGEDKPWIKLVPRDEGLSAAVAGLSLAPGCGAAEHSGGDAADDGVDYADDGIGGDSGDDSAKESMVAGKRQGGGAQDSDGGAYPRPVRRGIEIRVGAATFTNVSLAHCHSLNVAVRCARCKAGVELKGIAPTVHADKDHQMWKACDTCSTVLGVRFRPDWMFAGSTTVGYLDCSGCAPTDLLPSKFTLACEACAMNSGDEEEEEEAAEEQTKTAGGAVGAVGIAANAAFSCRACYARMSVHLQEPQFVRLQQGVAMGGHAGAAQISRAAEHSRKTKVNRRDELARLGVVPGQPLPDNGACKHYRRSTRWLRFPCCGKAYPCVTCHDDKEDHAHEFAQSMLCGHCAREQRIAQAQQTGLCAGCGAQLFKRVDGHRAFWQGGSGVRDQARMSRKDPKKYQGLGKTVAQKNVATPKK
ncbi:hypothetical protein IWQ56_001525 [Coemansia nantahalensis]|nr:hypothetical protein IWQ56_001525 [Coemansia nantahalensis]